MEASFHQTLAYLSVKLQPAEAEAGKFDKVHLAKELLRIGPERLDPSPAPPSFIRRFLLPQPLWSLRQAGIIMPELTLLVQAWVDPEFYLYFFLWGINIFKGGYNH